MTTDDRAVAAATPTETIPAVVSRAGGRLDGPDSLVDATIAAPGAPTGHDLVVEVQAVSVNPVDVKVRASGNSGGEERVLGWDASGTVLAVGEDVTLFRPGDEVFYAGSLERPGSYAAQQLVDERIVGPKPSTLTHAEAAALPLTSITAWEALFDKLGLTVDSTGSLLVLGAAGGVGSILIQLAKALTGVRVIATASRPESRAWVEALGADAVVDHGADDLDQQILAASPGGVDYVFTSQSKGRIPLFTEVVRPFGEIVAIDDERDLDLLALKSKAISWHWELMFTRPRYGYDLEAQHRALTRIAELVDAGRIRTTLTQALAPLDAARLREAHRIVETGHAVGKIVVSRA
ncbi:zinc-binding alcohol dehydrogenase family protein [Actinomyces sp. B33]|uniref:zinc-binding alcohol dehydrogenase family protein n=1 Tax=Actinomyces sp. B33 TaxID=2942131 RepID=UPI0023418CE5|nr:zinc-binding alcohol dehydrogenase family protein [Actinomyces sp. B33]MDC4233741.1 zinc-binding alcohol dehydrogenase family protein [Actinomyces sp. B33]